jgi:hypothetical protein
MTAGGDHNDLKRLLLGIALGRANRRRRRDCDEMGHMMRSAWKLVMPIDQDHPTSIAVTAFKSRCLAVIDDVAQGRTGRWCY